MSEKNEPVKLLAVTLSRCCNAHALLVRSRAGGYISKNGTVCNKAGHAYPQDIEPLECCGKTWPVVIINKNSDYVPFQYRYYPFCEVYNHQPNGSQGRAKTMWH
jgi:hypothetical protein